MKLAVQLTVGVVLSPFILHKLGDGAFGVWVLLSSVTAYYGLFDFGILAAAPRYVARFVATKDEEGLSRFVNTSLAACAVLGLVVLGITAIGAQYLGALFKIPPEFLGTARIVFLLVGAEVALGFPMHVFGCVLEGYQAFASLNLTHIVTALARGALVFAALSFGGTLEHVALISVVLSVLRHLVCARIVVRTTPVRLSIAQIDASVIREIAGFSALSFIWTFAENLRFQSDAIVIGAFLGPAAIAYFAIGSKLAEYPGHIVNSLAQIFSPMASAHDVRGDRTALSEILVSGNRACALVIFPLCATMIILGRPTIAVWVGPEYHSSYPVLVILMVSKTLFLAQGASMRILIGLGRLRALIFVVCIDGVSNLLLSIALLPHWGIIGVALGTAVPLALTSIFFLPMHLCRVIGVPLVDFLRRAYLHPVLLTLPAAGALMLFRELFPPHGWIALAWQVASAAVIYGISLWPMRGTAEERPRPPRVR